MRQINRIAQAGMLLFFVCLPVGGCGNGRREARQELTEEVTQRQAAKRESMEIYQLAMSEYQADHSEKAYELFQQSVNVNSRNASAWVGLGILEYGRNSLFDAAYAFSQAVRLEPRRFESHYNLGMVYEMAGKYTQAIASYEKAMQIAPDEPTVMENLARCYIKSGQKEQEALELIDRALRLEQRPLWKEWLELQKSVIEQRRG